MNSIKSKIIKYILLSASLITLIGILLVAHDSISGALSFFNNDDVTMAYGFSSQSNPEAPSNFEQTEGSSTGLYDVELHYLKKSFGTENGDTTFTLKYITLRGSRHQLHVGKDGLPGVKAMGPKAISAGYHQLESLHSIPFKNIDKNFWKQLLLSNVIFKTVLYSCMMLLIFLITKNAFKTTPFTYKIRNKLYFVACFMLSLVFIGWLFDGILSSHTFEYYKIDLAFNNYGTWLLMGFLMLFIASIFDYGIRLQKEHDLTI